VSPRVPPTVVLFVYGSLRSGEQNHRRMEGARPFGPTRTRPRYALYNLGRYPGMTEGDGVVEGELYEVDAKRLVTLDAFEGHPGYFRRGPVALEGGGWAEGYLLTRAQVAGRPLIRSGSWRARDKERQR
jgi:gamma-glutamylaminecyclotransferase